MPEKWKNIYSVCPRGVQTRWLCACVQLKWMISRLLQIEKAIRSSKNPEIKSLRIDFIKPLFQILSPLLEFVTAIEGQNTYITEAFPIAVLTFEKLRNVHQTFSIDSEYFEITSYVSSELYKLTLNSDYGAKAALAYSFTPPGQNQSNFKVPLPVKRMEPELEIISGIDAENQIQKDKFPQGTPEDVKKFNDDIVLLFAKEDIPFLKYNPIKKIIEDGMEVQKAHPSNQPEELITVKNRIDLAD
ncbi:MAG: hypothetical protein EZS28_036105 [Streblomastix strix]|uniref:Uncharacterized protein n=1 Tax=Streblomastix strix TaxID=222440 RepID=A0A5J4UCW1_9EUKA|nr:MAG: hypothetical protein EZS28_036105 [Streblomastix strix]